VTLTTDVAILGGGVVGCSIAYNLAKEGIGSVLIEKGEIGSGSSGASSGMVSPLWHLDPKNKALFGLGLRSLELFPSLAEELAGLGIDPEFRRTGILKVARTEDQLQALKTDLKWQNKLNLGVRWLNRSEVFAREPEINKRVLGGVFSPLEGQVNAKRLVEALTLACMRRGVRILTGTEAIGLKVSKKKVNGVRTTRGVFTAGHTVIAIGHWTRLLRDWGYHVPIRAVKGQRIRLRKTGFLPSSVVYSFGGTTVPQLDGSIIVGATREIGKADVNPTVGSLQLIIARAISMWPILRDAVFIEASVGVRPGSLDDVPFIGPVPDWENISVATGHDWAGTMLSPGTGEAVTRYIKTGDAEPLWSFRVDRFR
jgi:glycine oxidase